MIINTPAPISLDNLKKYFTDNSISYVIDYSNSTLKGAKLLTYVSNLDLPIDIEFDPKSEDGQELIKAYLESTALVNVLSLELAVIDYLLDYRFSDTASNFVLENNELFSRWAQMLDSATIFNMYMLNDESFKNYARQFPEQTFDKVLGINFVQLFKHDSFYTFYQKVDQENLKFIPQLFDGYIFKGKNLYSFWAVETNPLFLLTWGIASGITTGEEYANAYALSLSEINNVSPI